MGTGTSKNSKRRAHGRRSSALDIGPYSLRHLIGRGSFAEVRMAVHKPSCTEVAIKIITKATLKPADQKRIQIERDVHGQLTHPHIVRLIEVIETETHLYLVMELAKCNLSSYFSRVGKIDETKCKLPFFQLASAIEFAHSKGFVHRDIKLENIYMTNHGVVIGDWGLACPWSKSISRKSSVGTPAYCSPEIVQGTEYCGPEVDVWSLGVVLYRLISGQLPFDGVNMQEDLLSARYQLPAGCSTELSELLKTMLEPHAGKRATLDEVLESDWLRGAAEQDAAMAQASSANNMLERSSSDQGDQGGSTSDDDGDDADEDDDDTRRRSLSQGRNGSRMSPRGASKSASKHTSSSAVQRSTLNLPVPTNESSPASPLATSRPGTPGKRMAARTKVSKGAEEEVESEEERLVTRSTPATHLVVATN